MRNDRKGGGEEREKGRQKRIGKGSEGTPRENVETKGNERKGIGAKASKIITRKEKEEKKRKERKEKSRKSQKTKSENREEREKDDRVKGSRCCSLNYGEYLTSSNYFLSFFVYYMLRIRR